MRPIAKVLWILLGASLLASQPASEADPIGSAHALAERATRALLDGSAERAERFFREATAKVTDFPAARLALGHIALARGDAEAALVEYAAAKRGYETLGSSLIEVEQKRYEQARRTVKTLGREADRLRRLSKAATEGEQARRRARIDVFDGMIRQFRAVRPYDGEGAPGEVHYHLGNALYRLKQFEPAVEAWRVCTRKSPDFAPAYGNLAVGLVSLGRLEEARVSAATAERLGLPIHPDLTARLAAAPIGD